MSEFTPAVADLLPIEPLSEQHFLDLFDRLLPDHYLEPLKNPGPGYEVLQAYAAVASRVSEGVAHIGTGNFIGSAQGGAYSVGTVQFYRDNTIYGSVVLKAGTIVGTADGYTYQTLTDATLAANQRATGLIPVQSTVRGWLYNKPGPKTAADGSNIPGSIDQIVSPVIDVSNPQWDPTLKVAQYSDTVGGASPMLDGLGYDRGMPRLPGETDASYRARIAFLPDTGTIGAVQRQVERTLAEPLAELGLSYRLHELWDLRIQTGWDHPMNVVIDSDGAIPFAPVGTTITNFTENVFAWDYNPEDYPHSFFDPGGWLESNRLFDCGDYEMGVILLLPYAAIPMSRRGQFIGLYKNLSQTLIGIKPANLRIYIQLDLRE